MGSNDLRKRFDDPGVAAPLVDTGLPTKEAPEIE